jgi:hypothetical protein
MPFLPIKEGKGTIIIPTKCFFSTALHTPSVPYNIPFLYVYFSPTFTPFMDTKVTLSFNEEVVRKAKEYAASQNISLSRLVEFLLNKTITGQYSSLEDFPIAAWVQEVSEGPGVYRTKKRTRKATKDEYFASRKK